LGASTFIYNGQYFIALNHGSFHVLGDLFSRLLSDSRVLTWVGNAQAESTDPGDMVDYYTSFDELVDKAHNGQYHFRSPIDPFRRDVAFLLTKCALCFLIEHELSHILFGHLDFLETRGGNAANRLDRQTMEFQADITATLRSGLVVLRGVRGKTDFALLSRFSEVERILLFHFAVSLLIRIHGNEGYFEDSTGTKNHPPNHLRWGVHASYLHPLAQKAGVDVTIEELWTRVILQLNESEKAYTYLTGQVLNVRPYFSKEYQWRSAMHRAIHENWNPMREKMLNFTYINVLPWEPWKAPDHWAKD